MRHFSRALPRALAAALILCPASVTATAVAGNGNGNGGAGSGNGNATTNSGGNNGGADNAGNGNGPATAPAAGGAAPATPPGQAKRPKPAAPATAPGQAKKTTTTPGDPTAPTPVPLAAAPVIGKSMGLEPATGRVHVRLPGSTGYVSLSAAGSVPSGAVIDARHGTVRLRTAIDATGGTQTAAIRGAVFEIRQSATGKGMTDLILKGGRPAGCPATGTAAVARAAVASPAAKIKPDRLWARDRSGRFRTRGRNSVATVRGTRWSTRETCAGTLTRVMAGAVDVFDLRTHRTVRVRAGHTYLARTSG